MAEPLPITDELAAKINGWSTEVFLCLTPARISETMNRHGIALVDRSRTTLLIDERVYTGALLRSREWERLALPYVSPLLPGKCIWRELSAAVR